MTEIVNVNFGMDRNTYNQYKNIVANSGQSVKGNLICYMQTVIKYGIPNAETIEAINEVQELKRNPRKKTYDSFSELLEDLNDE